MLDAFLGKNFEPDLKPIKKSFEYLNHRGKPKKGVHSSRRGKSSANPNKAKREISIEYAEVVVPKKAKPYRNKGFASPPKKRVVNSPEINDRANLAL